MHTLGYAHVQPNKTRPNCFPNVVSPSVLPAALFEILLVSCSQPVGLSDFILAFGSGVVLLMDLPFISFITVSLNSSPWVCSHCDPIQGYASACYFPNFLGCVPFSH